MGRRLPDLWGCKVRGASCQVREKLAALNPAGPLKLARLGGRAVCGMRGVAVKGIDITQNPDCEGSIPAPD